MKKPDYLIALSAPFPASEVKVRQGPGGKQLDYIAIEQTLQRFLDHAPSYSWEATVDVRLSPPALDAAGNILPDKFLAIATGNLSVEDKTATGVGAMTHADPDMAVKSANSEAFKNAAKNGFGVALELWNADHRDAIAKERKLLGGDVGALKLAVYARAVAALGVPKPLLTEVADFYNVTPAALADPEVLMKIYRGDDA